MGWTSWQDEKSKSENIRMCMIYVVSLKAHVIINYYINCIRVVLIKKTLKVLLIGLCQQKA